MKTEKNEFSLVVRASARKSRPVQLLFASDGREQRVIIWERGLWERVEIGIQRVFKDICIHF